MNGIIRFFAQKYANFIMNQLERTISYDSDFEFNFWLEMGLRLDSYCTNREIYLD